MLTIVKHLKITLNWANKCNKCFVCSRSIKIDKAINADHDFIDANWP